jgi:hypothetical protein
VQNVDCRKKNEVREVPAESVRSHISFGEVGVTSESTNFGEVGVNSEITYSNGIRKTSG